jgi:hypothetical protein
MPEERALSCPICHERKPKRFCPAEGEKICPVCCGTAREITIDCPADCPFLIAAHRYEREHRQALPPDEVPFPEVRISGETIAEQQDLILVLSRAILEAARELRATDGDAILALNALAETYRTLQAGIYYEHPPEAALAREIYSHAAKTLADLKRVQSERAGFPAFKDGDVFTVLVFLVRVSKQETGSRSRSRAFLDFLRSWIPVEKESREPSRIITA